MSLSHGLSFLFFLFPCVCGCDCRMPLLSTASTCSSWSSLSSKAQKTRHPRILYPSLVASNQGLGDEGPRKLQISLHRLGQFWGTIYIILRILPSITTLVGLLPSVRLFQLFAVSLKYSCNKSLSYKSPS